jgi:hypothetical protein
MSRSFFARMSALVPVISLRLRSRAGVEDMEFVCDDFHVMKEASVIVTARIAHVNGSPLDVFTTWDVGSSSF